MTAADRLRALAGKTGTAAALLLSIGVGATTGAALLDYSGLETGTASAHLLVDKQQDQAASGGSGGIESRLLPPLASIPAPTTSAVGEQRKDETTQTPAPLTENPALAFSKPSVSDPQKVSIGDSTTGDEIPIPSSGDPNSPDALPAAPAIAPDIIATHFDIAQIAADNEAQAADTLRRQRDDEALLLILALSEGIA